MSDFSPEDVLILKAVKVYGPVSTEKLQGVLQMPLTMIVTHLGIMEHFDLIQSQWDEDSRDDNGNRIRLYSIDRGGEAVITDDEEASYGHTLKWNSGGEQITTVSYGCQSPLHAKTQAVVMALENGWIPPKWWQFWRRDDRVSREVMDEARRRRSFPMPESDREGFLSLASSDSVPPELAEQLAAKFPGMEIKFAGDNADELPPAIAEAVKKLERSIMGKFASGQCMDCDRKIENFPSVEDMPDDWEVPDGWHLLSDHNNNPVGWCCPTCDEEEKASGKVFKEIDISGIGLDA